jgi:GalNAc-alpha-(1->4)-GalNAc-alpha-(1->3)-diNAcBac-PP-undecaprenol alpha-1,4-N-acetyl-D-galactosaminyltransferase
MKLLLVIPALTAGGAERVISLLANYWAGKSWPVTLVTLDEPSSDFYPRHPGVKRIGLGLMAESLSLGAAVRHNWRRVKRLRQVIRVERPEIVISFVDTVNVLTVLATFGLGLPVIISERTEPRHHNPGRMWLGLRRLTYPWADAIVAQSASVCQWLRHLSGKRPFCTVIPNPLNPDIPEGQGSRPKETTPIDGLSNRRLVMSLGRFSLEKGYDLLIRGFALVAPDHPVWDLVIIGDGPERDALGQLAAQLGIASRVHFPGRLENPAILLSQADLFVLPSRYEGFPNALLEAMACGVAAISFDCPSGPREIIRDGVNGLLVPPENIQMLSAAMARLMADAGARQRLAAKAVEVKARFSLEKVGMQWEALLTRCLR